MLRAALHHCFRGLAGVGVVAVLGWVSLPAQAATKPAPAPAPAPLHERVDTLIESEFAGPLTPPASDADFLRRAYLDFTGMIPSATEARVASATKWDWVAVPLYGVMAEAQAV